LNRQRHRLFIFEFDISDTDHKLAGDLDQGMIEYLTLLNGH
jgi:hypothetical protein